MIENKGRWLSVLLGLRDYYSKFVDYQRARDYHVTSKWINR